MKFYIFSASLLALTIGTTSFAGDEKIPRLQLGKMYAPAQLSPCKQTPNPCQPIPLEIIKKPSEEIKNQKNFK